jgi:hypothetical protein
MSSLQVNRVVDTSGGVLAPISSVMRNRIINGAMTIDQRNAGSAVSADNSFPVDRYNFRTVGGGVISFQRSTTAPAGFVNSLALTVTTADTSIAAGDNYQLRQTIEGFNVADLGFGTANAKTVTFSFWVRSSLTGTFGGNLVNAATNRSYVFQYTITAANTWEQKSITIAGDTTGTWATDNSGGITVTWDLGSGTNLDGTANTWAAANYRRASGNVQLVGTNGATFYITGVQLEVGTQATSFEYRQYGQELSLCQRYYTNFSSTSSIYGYTAQAMQSDAAKTQAIDFKVTMRATPTITLSAAGNSSGQSSFLGSTNAYVTVGTHTAESITPQQFIIFGAGYSSTGWSTGTATSFYATGTTMIWQASAEL